MRAPSLLALILGLLALPLTASADQPAPVVDSATAEVTRVITPAAAESVWRNREILDLRARLDERLNIGLHQRHLDSKIRLTAAEVESLRRVARQYGQFSRFIDDGGFLVTREQLNLDLLAAELRLGELRGERRLLNQHQHELRRLNYLQMAEAREKLELAAPGEPAESIIIVIGSSSARGERPATPATA